MLAAISLAVANAQAFAATWYVTTSGSDANTCLAPDQPCATITGAIGKASAGETVNVATGTYTSSTGEVVLVNKNIVLSGGWSTDFVIQSDVSRVDGQLARIGIHVTAGTAQIERFLIENGQGPEDGTPPSFSYAGGILVRGGSGLQLDESTVRNNRWGGIWSSAPVTVTNSTLSGNTGRHGSGGGITVSSGALTVTNSTISGNSANFGGGILVLSAPAVQLSNVTIVGNAATTGTSSDEGVGGGVRVDNTTLHFRNSIVAGNTATRFDPDFSPAPSSPSIVSLGYNIGTGFSPAPTDLVTSDPRLDALANNGGPTQTRAPLVGSPAVDGGNPAGCRDANGVPLATDQRGGPRALGYACDIGAYEAEPPVNDDFADAISLDALLPPLTGSNAFATKENGEPEHAFVEGGSSIWYRWAPSFTGPAFVATQGSAFDSLLGIYSGGTVSSLLPIALNDDAHPAVPQSKACFHALAGGIYHVAVDGFLVGVDEGNVTLAWGPYISSDPCAVLPPSISGTPQVGTTLTMVGDTWVGTPSGFIREWGACDDLGCFLIPGASGSTYTPPAEMEGLLLFARVIAQHPSNPALDGPSYSALTAPVAAAPPAPSPPPAPPPPPPPPAPPPPAPPPPPSPPRPSRIPQASLGSTATVAGRLATLPIRCTGAVACRGVAEFFANVPQVKKLSYAVRRKIGTGRFSVAARRRGTIRIRLTPGAAQLVRRKGRVRAQLVVRLQRPGGARLMRKTITLVAKRR